MPDMKKKMPKVDPGSPAIDKQMSSVIRGARTMGPGRKGGDDSKAAIEAILMASEPAAGSALPSGMSALGANETVSDMRMAALLKAMRDSKLLPSPMTR